MDENSAIVVILVLASVVSLAGVIYPFKPFKRRWAALVSFFACFILIGALGPSPGPTETALPEVNERRWAAPEGNERLWVTSERLNRRTCPSESCGVVGQLFFREEVTVHEERDRWARITQPYDASCVGGRSEYVDTGNAACDPANGITDGQFAEWASVEYLSKTRPPDPAAGASGIEELVAGSDDFARYRTAFVEATQSLISQRHCTERDFRDMGGWVKSSSHRSQPIYFTYCGGATVANRLYLNADTGEIFK
ncbi:SH3 domain-containing protein [Roseobacter weihaiensis]|uniref:SH3 domain-containing protein n=1 Tax=Roseobacter weihaiensis TaxID=2763262 RepID=UPI001D0B84D8|nr:SH3 domain-containing protein [Roseobacter sp. H9]